MASFESPGDRCWCASIPALVDAISRLLGPEIDISVIFKDREADQLYEDVNWTLGKTAEAMTSKKIVTASIASDHSGGSAVVFPASNVGGEMRFNLASMDFRGSVERLDNFIDFLLGNPEIQFFCRSASDSIILDLDPVPAQLTEENFPWDHWDLLEAAVRRDDGSWVHRVERRLGE